MACTGATRTKSPRSPENKPRPQPGAHKEPGKKRNDTKTMRIYSGNEGSIEGLATMRQMGLGRLIGATGWRRGRDKKWKSIRCWKNPKPGIPWCLDNGAFSAWTCGQRFDDRLFARVLDKVPAKHRPDFAIIPDIVAGGRASLSLSEAWLPRLPHGWPWYLAVQDGMTFDDVEPLAARVAGIFVGGSMPWKLREAEAWIEWAHDHGMRAHIGRVGTLENIVWAERIGADSIDSTTWARNDAYDTIDAARAQRRLEVRA